MSPKLMRARDSFRRHVGKHSKLADNRVFDLTQPQAAHPVSESRLRFLLALSDALRPLSDPIDVQVTACRVLGEFLQANRVGYAEDRGDGETVAVTRNYTDGVPSLEGVYRYVDYGPELLRAFHAGRTVVRPDIANDTTLSAAEKEAHAVLQLGATVNVPLLKAGRLVAILFLHFCSAHAFSPEEVALLEDVADRTWDAVDRARTAAALRTANDLLEQRVHERTAQVQALLRRLVSVQEEERQRLARDLHDQLGQQITALRMNLDLLQSRVAEGEPLLEPLGRTQALASAIDSSIDALTRELRPAALEHSGLSAALAQLVDDWSAHFGVPAEFLPGPTVPALPADVATNLYRLVQEALHNIAKHAGATHASVVLVRQGHDLMLIVEDDGCGFEPAAASSPSAGGLGLVHMRERATLAGGEFQVESTPGSGTTLYVRIPLPPATT